MPKPTRGATRLARATAFALVTLAVASGAHVSAGGGLPSMTVLALLAVPLTLAAVVLTGRRCGPLLLLGSLTTAQVVVHESLMALTEHSAAHSAVDIFPAQMGVHHAAQFLVSGQVTAHSAAAMGSAAVTGTEVSSLSMKAAHVLAALVTALLLARGEKALWQLACRLRPAMPGQLLSVGRRPLQLPVLVSLPALRPLVARGGPGLRGPPVRFAVIA